VTSVQDTRTVVFGTESGMSECPDADGEKDGECGAEVL
jgi:hypothetical protein